MEKLYITPQEQERVRTFINEQQEAWNQSEQTKMFSEKLQGKDYEPKPFPGFDEATALEAVRSGYKSRLEMQFARKRKREGW